MDPIDKAWNSAIENSKLLITLSAGIVSFSVAFLDNKSSFNPTDNFQKIVLLMAWLALLTSAGVGVLWTQNAFISILSPSKSSGDTIPNARSKKIKVPYNLQSWFFVTGVVLQILYGVVRMFCIS
ncbi:hypothetical protein ACN9ML_29275 [Dyadobacter endophyticus]|uniref:hypothetical protein n=1 Tax=Dyadobacter endophyticus TaxID=1749036 RepID=UPI003CEC1768